METTVVIITRDRPSKVKRLISSILQSKIRGLSLVLVDDSKVENFRCTEKSLFHLRDISEHRSSRQLRMRISELLEKSKIPAENRPLIETCVGIRSPFEEFAESLSQTTLFRKSFFGLLSESFGPYSVSRNLGMYCAWEAFKPRKIVFLDDDCYVNRSERLKEALRLVGGRTNGMEIVAVSGLYEDLSISLLEGNQWHGKPTVTSVLNGMDSFLRRSFLTEQQDRLTPMPYHMLGGALILDRKVFLSLPFDPFVPRGEDHAFCIDLKSRFGKHFAVVRDNAFVVQHDPSHVHPVYAEDKNAVRDIFRFIYLRAKTGRGFIPNFTLRWGSTILLNSVLDLSRSRQSFLKLWALLFLARTYARRNASKYQQLLGAWDYFLANVVA